MVRMRVRSVPVNRQPSIRSLRTLAAEGISVFISSGDCGAYTQRLPNIARSRSRPVPSMPSRLVEPTCRSMIAMCALARLPGVRVTILPMCMNDWGSGGGVSQNTDFKRPIWQIGTGTTTQYDGRVACVRSAAGFSPTVKAPNGLRQVPDVAAAAFPNIAVYYKGAWEASGGTSAAAPIWAAGALLVDQALQQKGKTALGGVPEFYTLANHPGSFHPL